MNYRVLKMSEKFYATPYEEWDLEFEVDDIEQHVRNGNPVLLCDDLEAAAEIFGVPVEKIINTDN